MRFSGKTINAEMNLQQSGGTKYMIDFFFFCLIFNDFSSFNKGDWGNTKLK